MVFKCITCNREWQTLSRYENHIESVHNGIPQLEPDESIFPHQADWHLCDDSTSIDYSIDHPSSYRPHMEDLSFVENAGSCSERSSMESSEGEDMNVGDTNAEPGLVSDATVPDDIELEKVSCEYFSENAGRPYQARIPYDPIPRDENGIVNYWHPFQNAFDFKMARQLINNSKTYIEEMFTNGLLPSSQLSFSSADSLYKKLEIMGHDLGQSSWSTGSTILTDGTEITFKYRNPVFLAHYLLKQYAYKEHLVYAPVKEFRGNSRIYSELHTADWWWETQGSLPDENGTVVPIILGSDATHLTQFSGGKKAWPVYMTIGNIKSTIRNKPSYSAIILLALLPVSVANSANREVGHKILSTILEPLNKYKRGIVLPCADGADRLCFLRLAGWIADHMEYCYLFHVKSNACPVCEVKFTDLGSGRLSLTRDYARYRQLIAFNNSDALRNVSVHLVSSSVMLAVDGLVASELWKPDILHVLFLGLFKHLLEWVEEFLKEHGRLNSFNSCWKSLEPYPNVRMPTKAYKDISQWQGPEMRTFSRIILVCLSVALDRPAAHERDSFKKALRCVSALVDFSLLVSYQSHDEETIGYLENYLHDFHDNKDIFLKYRASKDVVKTAQNAMKDTLASFNEQDQAQGSLTAKRKRAQANTNRAIAEDERNSILLDLSHFNFPKLHLLSHFSHCIRRFGSLPMWSTESTERAHKEQIKRGYQASNHGITYEAQIISHYLRTQTLQMRELNLKSLAYDGLYGEGTADVLDLLDGKSRRLRNKANRAGDTSLAQQIQNMKPYVGEPVDIPKWQLYNLVICKQHSDTAQSTQSVADLEQFYDIPNLSQHIKGYFNTLAKLGLPVPPLDVESIKKLQTEAFKKLTIPLSRIDEGVDVHNVYATGPLLFHTRKRADWVWYQPEGTDESRYGILHGRLPARVLALFKVS
jgi:hypothetical protein